MIAQLVNIYTDNVKSKYNSLDEVRNLKWNTLPESYPVILANKIIPRKERLERNE